MMFWLDSEFSSFLLSILSPYCHQNYGIKTQMWPYHFTLQKEQQLPIPTDYISSFIQCLICARCWGCTDELWERGHFKLRMKKSKGHKKRKDAQNWNVIFLLWDYQRLIRKYPVSATMRENKQRHPLLVRVLIDIHFLEDNLSILVKILVIHIIPT